MTFRSSHHRLTALAALVALLFTIISYSSSASFDITERVHARSLWERVPRVLASTSAAPSDSEDEEIRHRWEYDGNRRRRALLGRQVGPKKPVEPASSEAYDTAEQKGNTLMCWMNNPSLAGEKANSQWNKYEDIAEWGWIGLGNVDPLRNHYGGEREKNIADLLKDGRGKTMQIYHKDEHAPETIEGTLWHYPVSVLHLERLKLDRADRTQPTDAQYTNNFYSADGVIVGEFNYGPRHQIEIEYTSKKREWDPVTDHAPRLQQLSDVWFLTWQRITDQTQCKGLRYVVQHNVVNEVTNSVLASVLQNNWPEEIKDGRAPGGAGKTIKRGDDGFAALLGTNNLWGVPWMLIQRQNELGKKRVKQITAWTEHPDVSFYQPNMIVELEDVPDEA